MEAINSTDKWQSLLRRYAQAGSWSGNSPASEESLRAAENKLKIQLPASYRSFLLTSNGWDNAQEIGCLRQVESIRWFRREHPEWLSAYAGPYSEVGELTLTGSDYFDYANVDSIHFDVGHLKQTLCISEGSDDSVLLLNPMVVWPNGEWEVWLFSNSMPGALRFRSFAEWMRMLFARASDEEFHHERAEGELPVVYLDPPAKPDRRIRKPEVLPVLADVLKLLGSKSTARRKKGVRQAGRIKSALALEELVRILRYDPESSIRSEAAQALGSQGFEEALDPLAAAVEDPAVNSTAVAAIGKIKGEKAAQSLLSILEAGGEYSGVAAYQLSLRRDERAIPILARYLVSTDPCDDQLGDMAGSCISDFRSEAAYKALERASLCKDRKIRVRAIQGIGYLADLGLDKNVRQRARDLLKRCFEAESDERTRHWIGGWIQASSGR